MKPEIAAKWVEALRSGEYQQTTGALQARGGHCCLGVLCELYKKETGSGEWEMREGSLFFQVDDYSSSLVLPYPVMQWSGMSTGNGQLDKVDATNAYDYDYLSSMNDAGTSFADLANVIEKRAAEL